jgi:hypothetical protein
MRTIRASGSNLLGKLSTWNLDEKENASICVACDRPRGKTPIAPRKPQIGEFYKTRQRRECSRGNDVNRRDSGAIEHFDPSRVDTYRSGGDASDLPQERAFSMIAFDAMNFHALRFS